MSNSSPIPDSLLQKNASNFASYSESVYHTDWKGNGNDILMAYLYLQKKKYKSSTIEFPHENLTQSNRDMMWKLVVRYSCYQKGGPFKITFPGNEDNYFQYIKNRIQKNNDKNKNKTKKNNNISSSPNKKRSLTNKTRDKRPKKLFFGSGVFLGTKACSIHNGHYNMIIFDVEKMTIERIEPYGRSYSDDKLEQNFDQELQKIFSKNGFPKVKVVSPSKFMSKKSFQWYEENYELRRGIGNNKDSDPFGYCGGWSTFLCDLRLKYPRVNTRKLIKLVEKKIIGEKILRNYIRNISQHYVRTGRKLLGNVSMSESNSDPLLQASLEKKAEKILRKSSLYSSN